LISDSSRALDALEISTNAIVASGITPTARNENMSFF
jgi:hypothetical protein